MERKMRVMVHMIIVLLFGCHHASASSACCDWHLILKPLPNVAYSNGRAYS